MSLKRPSVQVRVLGQKTKKTTIESKTNEKFAKTVSRKCRYLYLKFLAELYKTTDTV